MALTTELACRIGFGAGVERRKRNKAAQELPQALIQTRIADAFRAEDTNAIVTMLGILPKLMTQ